MKPVSTVLYEVSSSEIAALKIGYTVIQHNTESNRYRLLQAKIDYFSFAKKFKYYLFQAPPLPEIKSFTENSEGVLS